MLSIFPEVSARVCANLSDYCLRVNKRYPVLPNYNYLCSPSPPPPSLSLTHTHNSLDILSSHHTLHWNNHWHRSGSCCWLGVADNLHFCFWWVFASSVLPIGFWKANSSSQANVGLCVTHTLAVHMCTHIYAYAYMCTHTYKYVCTHAVKYTHTCIHNTHIQYGVWWCVPDTSHWSSGVSATTMGSGLIASDLAVKAVGV